MLQGLRSAAMSFVRQLGDISGVNDLRKAERSNTKGAAKLAATVLTAGAYLLAALALKSAITFFARPVSQEDNSETRKADHARKKAFGSSAGDLVEVKQTAQPFSSSQAFNVALKELITRTLSDTGLSGYLLGVSSLEKEEVKKYFSTYLGKPEKAGGEDKYLVLKNYRDGLEEIRDRLEASGSDFDTDLTWVKIVLEGLQAALEASIGLDSDELENVSLD